MNVVIRLLLALALSVVFIGAAYLTGVTVSRMDIMLTYMVSFLWFMAKWEV